MMKHVASDLHVERVSMTDDAQHTSALSSRTTRAAVLVVGIVCIGVWGNLLGYSSSLVPAATDASSQMISTFYTLGRLAVALVFVAAAPVLQRHAGAIGLAFGCAMAPATLLLCLSCATQGTPVGSLLLSQSVQLPVNSLLAGMGFLAVSVPLFVELARLVNPRRAAALAMTGIVGECLATSVLASFASTDVQLLVCLICPTLAGACLFASTRWSGAGTQTEAGGTEASANLKEQGGNRRVTRATGTLAALGQRNNVGSLLMIAQLAFAMVLASTLRTLSDMGPWGLAHQGYLGIASPMGLPTLVTCFIVVVATLAVYVLPRRAPSQVRTAVALVVVLCGLQLASARPSAVPEGVLDGAVMGTQLFSRVIIWVTFMECVRQLRMQPLRVNGITCLFNVAGTMLSTAALHAGAAGTDLALGLLAALLSVTIVAIALPYIGHSASQPAKNTQPVLEGSVRAIAGNGAGANPTSKFVDGAQTPEPATATKEPDQPEQPTPLHEFAAGYGISPREEQVLGLLLDGCTRGQIERLLGLSEGTIRTHVNAVYRKLDVHSKGDARTLYDKWEQAATDSKPAAS